MRHSWRAIAVMALLGGLALGWRPLLTALHANLGLLALTHAVETTDPPQGWVACQVAL